MDKLDVATGATWIIAPTLLGVAERHPYKSQLAYNGIQNT